MTVHCPPAFHLSYVAIVHASISSAIFLSFSPLCSPSFFLFLSVLVLRHLSVCNTAESVSCWCVLTICINWYSFLSTYSTIIVISTTWAASNCTRPLPHCFLGTYKFSTSAFGWCCPWMVISFLVFRSSFCNYYYYYYYYYSANDNLLELRSWEGLCQEHSYCKKKSKMMYVELFCTLPEWINMRFMHTLSGQTCLQRQLNICLPTYRL